MLCTKRHTPNIRSLEDYLNEGEIKLKGFFSASSHVRMFSLICIGEEKRTKLAARQAKLVLFIEIFDRRLNRSFQNKKTFGKTLRAKGQEYEQKSRYQLVGHRSK